MVRDVVGCVVCFLSTLTTLFILISKVFWCLVVSCRCIFKPFLMRKISLVNFGESNCSGAQHRQHRQQKRTRLLSPSVKLNAHCFDPSVKGGGGNIKCFLYACGSTLFVSPFLAHPCEFGLVNLHRLSAFISSIGFGNGNTL